MSPKLRIVLVGPIPPPYGGMANQTQQLAELLRGEGQSVTLVPCNAPYSPRWVANVPVLRAVFRLFPYLLRLWREIGSSSVAPSSAPQLVHVMANSGWSWHLFAAPAIWIAALRRVPVIVNYRGGEAESFLSTSARWVRRTMRKAAALIVPSGFLKATFARFDMSAAIVPNIVDLRRFSNPQPHRTNRRRLLVARNLEPIYDNESAIRALAIVRQTHPDATLTVAGSGPLADALQSLVKTLGLAGAVVFTGRLDRDAMANAYRDADIALNPSLVDNMPNSVLEALASGVPVVSTHVGGVPYIVKDGETALLVPPKSPEAMAAAIVRLMDDAALAQRLIDNGLAEVQAYTWPRVWPVLAATYARASARAPVAA